MPPTNNVPNPLSKEVMQHLSRDVKTGATFKIDPAQYPWKTDLHGTSRKRGCTLPIHNVSGQQRLKAYLYGINPKRVCEALFQNVF